MLDKTILKEVEKLKHLFKESDAKRDVGLDRKIPEVERFDDIAYGADDKWHLLDIYLPKRRSGKLATIINIHGGGWIYGTKETYQFFGMSLAKEGFAFVNFNYRLAPEVVFPQELDDVNQAVHWVVQHAKDYQLDMEQVFFIGDSAGGQMAMQYLTILTNSSYREKFGYEKPDLTVRAAAINCGAAFVLLPDFVEGAAPHAYFTDKVIAEKREMLETEKYMTRALPPIFLTTANEDFIRDCTIRLDGYLDGKGIAHKCRSYGDEKHPQQHVFNYDIKSQIARACNQEILAFFREHLA